MSGGSFNYAFEKRPEEWYEAVDAIEIAALRAKAGYPFVQWHRLTCLTSLSAEYMLDFVKEYRRAAADAALDALATPEAREVVKSIEWITSMDSSWGRMVDAIVAWKMASVVGKEGSLR